MTEPVLPSEDVIVFRGEDAASDANGLAARHRPVWRILIIDDDGDVHTATISALANIDIQECRIEFVHAYSATEARALLPIESNIAVNLLEVVMEQEDAGYMKLRVSDDGAGIPEKTSIGYSNRFSPQNRVPMVPDWACTSPTISCRACSAAASGWIANAVITALAQPPS